MVVRTGVLSEILDNMKAMDLLPNLDYFRDRFSTASRRRGSASEGASSAEPMIVLGERSGTVEEAPYARSHMHTWDDWTRQLTPFSLFAGVLAQAQRRRGRGRRYPVAAADGARRAVDVRLQHAGLGRVGRAAGVADSHVRRPGGQSGLCDRTSAPAHEALAGAL